MRFIYTILIISLHFVTEAQIYTPLDNTSEVSFKIDNFGSSVDGTFKGLKGTIQFDALDLTSAKFDVTIDATTIETGISMRDKHLRKEDYFDAEKYPTIRFMSTKVEASGKSNEGMVTGQLTIKDTSKEISFPFTYSALNDELLLKGAFEINRRNFDVGGNSFSLSDDLVVTLEVRAGK